VTSPTTSAEASPFRWPAEWEPQDRVWLAWPHNRETWPDRFGPVPTAFAALVRAVAEVTPVGLLAAGPLAAEAHRVIGPLDHVELVDCPTNDCWIRDYGPTFVQDTRDGSVWGVDWGYNAWGGKYPPWDADLAAGERICGTAGCRRLVGRLTAEGGALETDGQDRLLTTPECLITDTRNPGWDAEAVARELHRCLGIREILWLDGGGLEGDDTDGHIDQLARFVDPENIVAAVADDPADPNREPLEANFRQLKLWGQQTTPPVAIHRLPVPPPRRIAGRRVPESYCNFLMVGGRRLLVPQFRAAAADARALRRFAELLPRWEIVGLDASDLVWGLGAFHCASQQQPAAGWQPPPVPEEGG